MAQLIKEQFPDCYLVFLVKSYTKPILQYFNHIDDSISCDDLRALPFKQAVQEIVSYKFDLFINAFANQWTAKLAKSAKIPLRIGTSRRIYHWLYCNRRVNFSRKKSKQHEAQLNLKLLESLGITSEIPLKKILLTARIPTDKKPLSFPRRSLEKEKFKLITHPGSYGNGAEWPIESYLKLISRLDAKRFSIYLTGSAAEKERFSNIINKLPAHAHFIMGTMELDEFCLFLSQADGMIASGTGPLHLAAALGIRTLGLFPPNSKVGIQRWRPLGKAAEYLTQEGTCMEKSCPTQCHCMQALSVDAVFARVEAWKYTGK